MSKASHLCVVAVTACLLLVACTAAEAEFGIEVSCDAGHRFTASYMVVAADGSSTSRSVEGQTVWRTNAKGVAVSVVAQRSTDEVGALTVKVYKDGKVVKEETTTAKYGMVSVAVR